MSGMMKVTGLLRGWTTCALLATVVLGCGGGNSSTPATPPPPPTWTLATRAPDTAVAGSGDLTVTATGSGYTTSSVVKWNGVALTTNYVSATSLTASVPAADLAAPGSFAVTVADPSQGDAGSAALQFKIADQTAPTIASLAPSTLIAGGASFQLTVTGTNFAPTAKVLWNRSALPTNYDSATQLTAPVTSPPFATSVGTAQLTVEDPASGNVPSKALTLTFTQPIPVVNGLTPANVVAAQPALSVTVSGQYFTSTAVVYFNGSARPTSLNSQGQLVAQLTTQDVAAAGTESITVEDPASANVPSNAMNFVIQPLPPLTLTSLYPARLPAGNST